MLTHSMLRPSVVLTTGLLLSGPLSLDAQELPQPAVVAQGQAIVRAAPDRAFVTIQAESRAKSPKEAQRMNAEAMAAVQQQLKGAGLSADAIRTLSVNLQPEFDWRDGRQTLRGYLASNAIEVRVDDLARVGDIVDLSVQSGATSVSGVRFDLKNREAIERQALKDAAADARARAEAAAAGAGRVIDRVIRIEEQRGFEPPPRPVFMAMRAEAQASDAPATPVAPGEIEVRATVTLTAQLK